MKDQNQRNTNMKTSQTNYIGDTFLFTNTRNFKKFEIMSFFRGGRFYAMWSNFFSKTFWNSRVSAFERSNRD